MVFPTVPDPVLTDELSVFSTPSSVAVVGASADHAKWGYWLALGALEGRSEREVYLVNRSGAQILDESSARSLSELPTVPELVAIAVPGPLVLPVIREALELGTRAFVVVSARVEDEAEIAELVRVAGAKLIGPNSLGIYSAEGSLQLMWGRMRPGSLAIVSQSGQLGSEIAALGARAGIGISRFVSLGNQIDVQAAGLLRSIAHDARTRTVGVYLEDFSRGGTVFEAVRELRAAGKAVVVLTTGDSVASRDLAKSHTGAMTSPSALVDAACRAAGAVRVRTPAELVQIAALVDRQDPPVGTRVAVISDSGGQGAIAADAADRYGLVLPELSGSLRARLEERLPHGASSRNPIDLAGAGEADLAVYAELSRLLAESGEVDAVVLSGYFGSYGEDAPALLATEREIAHRLARLGGAPITVHAMAPDSAVSAELSALGLLVVGRIEDALAALAGAYHATRPARASIEVEAVVGTTDASDQLAVRSRLVQAGLPFPPARIVRDAVAAAEAAAEFGGAVVLKAAWLAHKTEHGGVRLGLCGPDAARNAFAAMHAHLGDGDYTIERQDIREPVVEFIVSARRDPAFGPMVTVGFGGTETEIWQDLSTELAPVDAATARAMIRSLRSARLLDPWRGRPALAAESLAEIVVGLGRVLAASPDLHEIELNPVRVGVDGALTVDCLAIPVPPTVVANPGRIPE